MQAQAIKDCGDAIVAHENNPNNVPLPPLGCNFFKYAQGDRCPTPPIKGHIGGPYVDPVTATRIDETVEIPKCNPGEPGCPLNFCYWTGLHGPFWQASPINIPAGDPNYRGSFLNITTNANGWVFRRFVDPDGYGQIAPVGASYECTRFNETNAPDPENCDATLNDLSGDFNQGYTQTVLPPGALFPMSGFYGNVAQKAGRFTDYIRIYHTGQFAGLFEQGHWIPQSPWVGPLRGQVFRYGCPNWAPTLIVNHALVVTDNTVIVPPSQAAAARCFIHGLQGAWSSTRNNGALQPYVNIERSVAGIVARVWPDTAGLPPDRVGAYVSCFQIN